MTAQCSTCTTTLGHWLGRPSSLPWPEHRHRGQGHPKTGRNPCLPSHHLLPRGLTEQSLDLALGHSELSHLSTGGVL